MKKGLRITAIIASLVIASGAVAGCGSSAEASASGESVDGGETKTEILLASHPFNDTHPWQLGLEYLGDLLYERTDGRYDVEAHPSGSLSGGSNRSIVEMTGTGALQIMIHSGLSYQGFDEKYAALSLPFMFPDRETGFEVMNNTDIGKEAMTWLEDNGCISFAVCENGMRWLTNSKRKVETPDDMKGLKLRVPEANSLVDSFKIWGADPTILNMSEVYTSIQQGTVDGQENPVAVIDSNKLYEVCPYITDWTYCWDPAFIMFNKAFIDGLSEEDKEIFVQTSKDAAQYINQLIAETDAENIQTFKDYGCEVTTLTPEQEAVFREMVEPVYEEYREKLGSDLVDGLIQAVEEAKEKVHGNSESASLSNSSRVESSETAA